MFVLPINQDRESHKTPWLLISLIILDGLVLIGEYAAGPMRDVFLHWGFVPAQHNAITLVTSLFLHAGFWHYAGNMFFLWMFGKQVEECLGRWLFAAAFLVSGLGGNLLHYAFNQHSAIPCVGASGAISGIVGIFCILFPKTDFELVFYVGWIRLGSKPSTAYGAVLVWFIEQTLLGILTQTLRATSVAYWGHVGGFIVGVCIGGLYLLARRERVEKFRESSTQFVQQDPYDILKIDAKDH
jgi:membrane associated rhomboid family serine protease